jgi:hypothetical protein
MKRLALKRLAFLSLLIPTLIAPIQAQAQTGCVRFPQPPNPETELRYLLSHPGTRVCPAPNPNPAGQRGVVDQISSDRVNNTRTQICAMNGQRC